MSWTYRRRFCPSCGTDLTDAAYGAGMSNGVVPCSDCGDAWAVDRLLVKAEERFLRAPTLRIEAPKLDVGIDYWTITGDLRGGAFDPNGLVGNGFVGSDIHRALTKTDPDALQDVEVDAEYCQFFAYAQTRRAAERFLRAVLDLEYRVLVEKLDAEVR